MSIVLAATSRDFIDDRLIAADRLIFGVSWKTMVDGVASWPIASRLFSFSYSSLAWQPFVLLGFLMLGAQHGLAQRFVVAWILTLSLSLAAFPFAPALGGYLHYGLSPADYPDIRVSAAWDFVSVMEGARDGTLRTIGSTPVVGLVTFPSFHAAAAVILAWFGRKTRASVLFVPLNALMLLSTVPVGGHYLVDVVAGCLVAACGITLASVRPKAVRHASGRRLQHAQTG